MKKLLLTLIFGLTPVLIFAHTGDDNLGFVSGLKHPILGFDHFLAMVSVGIISAQIGGKAVWNVPLTFMFVMFIGGMLGMRIIGDYPIETGIVLSVVLLGAAIGLGKKVPIYVAMIFVGFFAIFHGYAHGAEMPEAVVPYAYALGFLSGTALIHILGVLIGHFLSKGKSSKKILKMIGWAIAAVGVLLFII